MHATPLLLNISLLLLTSLSPITCLNLSDDDTLNPEQDSSRECSANQEGSIPDWAANPQWRTSMIDCLLQLNTTGFNGADCHPKTADGTLLGPSFGFYKGERHYSTGGLDCFFECAHCLWTGISNHQAQTTSCHYSRQDRITERRKHCYVGFDYRTWEEGQSML